MSAAKREAIIDDIIKNLHEKKEAYRAPKKNKTAISRAQSSTPKSGHRPIRSFRVPLMTHEEIQKMWSRNAQKINEARSQEQNATALARRE